MVMIGTRARPFGLAKSRKSRSKMPPFVFQLEGRTAIDDGVKTVLPSEAAARQRAIRLAMQIATRSSRVRGRPWAIVVTDESGVELMSVHIPRAPRRAAA